MTALPLETERLRAERLESLLREVKGKAAAALAEKAAGGCGTVNAALAAEALRGMEGNSFTLTLPAGSGSPADLAPEVKRLSGKDGLQLVFLEDGGLAGGAIARDAAGRQYWDNSFKARLERFWPELRGALGAGLAGGRKNDRA
jgi:vacuolar-type H+-ATPase subunit E/Vma4